MYESLISNLREHAEWAHANEWESPITLGDDLETAIETIEGLRAEIDTIFKTLLDKHEKSNLNHDKNIKIEALIKNARVCYGDIEIDEDKEECSNYCIDSRDCRGTEIRWCRQWLIHDLCEAIEALQAELDRLKNCRHECKIVCLLDEYNKKCTELEKVKSELIELRIAWDMYGGAENITGAFAELEKVKAELDTLCKMQPVKLEKAEARSLSFVLAAELSEVRGELEKVKAERDKFEQMYLQSEVDATNLIGELTEVSAENARLRRERDAAVADMRAQLCLVCKKFKSCRPRRRDIESGGCAAFEWRGPDGRGEVDA